MAPIIFYDIPSTLPINAWSPNCWKTRYALNIKGVPYTTEWVEYPDIEALALQIGAAPTGTKDDGSPSYTLPIINDPNTGKVVSDSFLIAEYLDETYSGGNFNTLFPSNSKPLVEAFEGGLVGALSPALPLLLSISAPVLNPSSKEYFRRTREAKFGKKLEEFSALGAPRTADWAKAEEGFAQVAGWLAKNGNGPYVLGDTVSYADGVLGAWLIWAKIVTPGQGVKDLSTWQDGRWDKYLKDLEPFSQVY
ncbi:hypothetical protein CONPUDRAFT_127368 [Coniophora puteana RWD-64-598 SS2]|uniref:GST N-terminal domain-containing protein n=1 Tax=Coniophora puteana (strain RWD-64-598) TaxID=741705 RepID=A0A5M3MK61_CONPW|nr:uncharacterized protein CONPUDRAFT_127368 [Coniophora puteana RWD-64-598 SS2]EIW79330.1 hypothetical protein CONPUDRAFT_127368 [Coniophora puteana RWD-64-598 SS2]